MVSSEVAAGASATTSRQVRTTSLPAARAAALDATEVVRQLGSSEDGLSAAEAGRRLAQTGPNALRDHRASFWPVLARQLRSALLLLLLATAAVFFALGERSDAIIIASILTASVGLGFVNEYRAERASEALHTRVRHSAVVVRDGLPGQLDVTELVPGDLVHLELGMLVPADIRLTRVIGLECDEAVLTGESLPVSKSTEPVAAGVALPLSPFAGPLGFTAPPPAFYLALAGMVLAYLVMIEVVKTAFYAESVTEAAAGRQRGHPHLLHRRAARFSSTHSLPGGNQ